MPAYRPKILKFKLIICFALVVLLGGMTASSFADVINFKKLMPFVDIKIPGWTMQGKPSGTTVKQGPMSVSEASAEFKAGGKTLRVMVTDLMGRPFPLMLGSQLQMESDKEIVRTTKVQGFRTLEHYNKIDKEGELNISVAKRFLVKIDGKKIDNLKVLHDVAKHLDLKKLATLAK